MSAHDFDFWIGKWDVHNPWSGVDTPTPRWEQEFSGDGGATWESNWIMEFTRAW